MCVYSNGEIVDVVLKNRLEHKMYTWFREISSLISVKPHVIFQKDPNALPAECKYLK